MYRFFEEKKGRRKSNVDSKSKVNSLRWEGEEVRKEEECRVDVR